MGSRYFEDEDEVGLDDESGGSPRFLRPPRSPRDSELRWEDQKRIGDYLIGRHGYRPEQMHEAFTSGIDLRSFLPKPKSKITPTKNFLDEASGQIFDEIPQSDGAVRLRPRIEAETRAPLFRSKTRAFRGRAETGDEWSMDRNRYGNAENYQVTKPAKAPPKPKTVSMTDSEGRRVDYEKVDDPEGGVIMRPIPVKTEGGTPLYDTRKKLLWQSPDGLVKGEAPQDENGNWNEKGAQYQLSDTAKRWIQNFDQNTRKFSARLNSLNREAAQLLKDDSLSDEDRQKRIRGIDVDGGKA